MSQAASANDSCKSDTSVLGVRYVVRIVCCPGDALDNVGLGVI